MELAKDVFLTDAREPFFTVSLASRDLTAHRLLTGLSADERDALNHLLNDHVTAVTGLLRRSLARQEPDAHTTTFGCGT